MTASFIRINLCILVCITFQSAWSLHYEDFSSLTEALPKRSNKALRYYIFQYENPRSRNIDTVFHPFSVGTYVKNQGFLASANNDVYKKRRTRRNSPIEVSVTDYSLTSLNSSRQTASEVSLTGEHGIDKNDNGTNSTATEELPSPEPFFWRNNRPEDRYTISGSSRFIRPVRYTSAETRDSIPRSRPKPSFIKEGPNRIRYGDYVYILPEDEFGFVLDSDDQSSKKQRYKSKYGVNSPYRNHPNDELENNEEKMSFQSRPYARRRPNWRPNQQPPPQQESVPLLRSIINTGTGFLKMLNPLTYFTSEPTPPAKPYYARQMRNRYEYRPHSGTHYRPPIKDDKEEFVIYDRPTVQENYPEYRPHRPWKDETDQEIDTNYESTPQNFGYDPSYVAESEDNFEDNYSNLGGYSPDEFESNFQNNFERIPVKENPKNYFAGITSFDSKTRIKDSSYSPPIYVPKIKDSYDKKETIDYNEFKTNNIKDLDLIKNVKDPQTLDYLKTVPLRDDMYLGKDGNIYIKDKYLPDDDLYGLDMYGMEYPTYEETNKFYYEPSMTRRNSVVEPPNYRRVRSHPMQYISNDRPIIEKEINRMPVGVDIPIRRLTSFHNTPKQHSSSHSKFALQKFPSKNQQQPEKDEIDSFPPRDGFFSSDGKTFLETKPFVYSSTR